MPQRDIHQAAGRRSINPLLYVAVSGDVDWERWCFARTVYPILDQIEDLAFRIYADIPYPDKRHVGRVRREVESAQATEAMDKLLQAFEALPPQLIPISRLKPLSALNFVLKLVPRMMS